jgi:hypothetical protein
MDTFCLLRLRMAMSSPTSMTQVFDKELPEEVAMMWKPTTHTARDRKSLSPKTGVGARLTDGYMLGLNRPQLGAINDEASEAQAGQVREVSISGAELG